MTYTGTVRGGVVVFDPATGGPPEGAVVAISVTPATISSDNMTGSENRTPKTLAERYKNVIGKAEGLPEDAAHQHDHYLYGTPKR